MELTVKVQGVTEALEFLNPAKVGRAMITTLNETAKSTGSESSRIIRNEKGWKISKSDFDKKLSFKYARHNEASATLNVSRMGGNGPTGKDSFALPYFGAQEARSFKGGVKIKSKKGIKTQKRSKLGSGVTVQVKRGGGIARFQHGFIATMKSGHVGVFRRIAGSRKISEVKVVTVAQMFQDSLQRIGQYASDYFNRRFQSKIKDWKQL